MNPFLNDGFHLPVGKLFVVSGPSGSGKTSVTASLVCNDGIWRSISATTRRPRTGETEGKDYFFYSENRFHEGIKNCEFLEYARVHDNYYGTPIEPIVSRIKSGVHVILTIDLQGGAQVAKAYPEAVTIFIIPPNRSVLERRLRERGTESEESIAIRLANSDIEVKKSVGYRYLVINDKLEDAVSDIMAIIRAETLSMPEGGINGLWHNTQPKS